MKKVILVVCGLVVVLGMILLAWHSGILVVVVTEEQFWTALAWLVTLVAGGLLAYYLASLAGDGSKTP